MSQPQAPPRDAPARAAPSSYGGRSRDPLRRFGYGLQLPVTILQTVWASPEARRFHARVALVQLVIALSVTVLIMGRPRGLESSTDNRNVHISFKDGFHVSVDEEDERDEPDEATAEAGDRRLEKAIAEANAAGAPGAATRHWLTARLGPALAFWSEFFATLAVVEWIVIWLSREYHDALSKIASELSGVPPEKAPEKPGVRVNIRWLLKKVKRRIRGLLLVAAGAPVLWPLWIVPWVGDRLSSALLSVWAAYWLVVFTVGKTEHAWDWQDAPAPWYLRWAERAAARTPTRFWIWQWYAKLLRRMSKELSSPASYLERAPYEGLGLALARAVTRVPGLYTVFRPIIPVAATHVVMVARANESGREGSAAR